MNELALLCALVFLALYAVHRSLGYLIHRFGRGFGFTDATDIASLPLLAFLFSGFFLPAQPVALQPPHQAGGRSLRL